MLSGVLSSSLSAGWRSIGLIWWTFNIWVRPPGRFFADKAGSTGNFSDNLNAAAPSWWKSDQDALTISSVSDMYSPADICVFWAQDSWFVARRVWQPCHISKMSWNLAIQCNFFCSAFFFISMSLSVLLGFKTGSLAASNLWLAQANCLTTSFSRRVRPVVFDYLHPITSRPRENLTSTSTLWGMIEIMSRITLEISANFECVSSSFRHQSVISGAHNVLLISIVSER